MDHQSPVTTVLKVKYKAGCQAECLQWMRETASTAALFAGFVEKNIYFSAETDRELVNIFTFNDVGSLRVWEDSEARMLQTQKGKQFVEEVKEKSQLAGLSFMFPTVKSPRRWKMVIVTVAVIFCLLNSLVPLLQQLLTVLQLPALLRSLLGVVVMVSAMTYVILPFLSRVLSRWIVT